MAAAWRCTAPSPGAGSPAPASAPSPAEGVGGSSAGLEKQEKRGFKDLATLLSQLPKLAQGSARSISVAEAMEAGFLPALDEDQAYMFTP